MLRKAHDGLDVLEIFQALLRLLAKSKAPQMRLVDEATAYRSLTAAAAEGRLYVHGDFAILVDVGSPWHSDKRVLIEEIIVRWRKAFGNTVESAVAQLDVIAAEHGCVAVAAGDTQIGLMSPRYLAAGFKPLGTQFFKEIP